MEDSKMPLEDSKKPLEDEALEGVTGGVITDVYDNQGRHIGRHFLEDTEFWTGIQTYCTIYYACSKCGKPMHKGTMGVFYCDPFDRWEFSPSMHKFVGSLEEFQNWANS